MHAVSAHAVCVFACVCKLVFRVGFVESERDLVRIRYQYGRDCILYFNLLVFCRTCYEMLGIFADRLAV